MDAHQTGPGPQQTPNPAGLSEPEAFELEARNSHAPARLETLNSAVPSHYSPLRRTSVRFWRQHVSLAVPHVKCRDHLGQCYLFRMDVRSSKAVRLTTCLSSKRTHSAGLSSQRVGVFHARCCHCTAHATRPAVGIATYVWSLYHQRASVLYVPDRGHHHLDYRRSSILQISEKYGFWHRSIRRMGVEPGWHFDVDGMHPEAALEHTAHRLTRLRRY